MAWIMVASAGVGAGAKIFGAFKSAKANKDNQKLLDTEQEQNKADYNNSANKDFLGTNVAKSAVKQLNQANESNRKAVAGRAAITGASDEAVVAGNTAANQTFQNGLSDLAGKATEYQNHQDAIFRGQRSALNDKQRAINTSKSETAANLAEAGSDLMGAAAGSGMLTGGSKLSSTTFDPSYGRKIKAPKGEMFVN